MDDSYGDWSTNANEAIGDLPAPTEYATYELQLRNLSKDTNATITLPLGLIEE